MQHAAPRLETPRLRRERVISLIRPGNQRSIAVAEAIGETLHGTIDMMGGRALACEVQR